MFRDVGVEIGVETFTTDPLRYASALAARLSAHPDRRIAIVAPLPDEGSWDLAIATELLAMRSVLLVVVGHAAPAHWSPTYDIATIALDENGLGEPHAHADRQASIHATVEGLDRSRRDVLTQLALAGRYVTRDAFEADATEALDALSALGLVSMSERHVALAPEVDATPLVSAASVEQRLSAARLLSSEGADACPWAETRAAELLVEAGELEAADIAMTKASRSTDDESAAAEIRSRWEVALAPIDGAEGFRLRLRAAERALASGEAHEAERWANALEALRPGSAEGSLVTGRALVLLGDHVAARAVLERAIERASEDDTQSKIVAVLSEVAYVAGDLTRATEHAERSIALAKDPATRLEGRNILGKIHLAAARWEEAERHFAVDADTAAQLGDGTAELRARLNRAIALMSCGSLGEARTMLEQVLADGARRGEDRARAFALRNLAVIAYRRREYGQALELWDSAVRFPSALCGRIATAFTLANLADLRLRLGLFDHAEHTLAFGRRMLGGHPAPATLANFAVVAARLALARGDVALARRESDDALAQAEAAGDRGDRLPDACLVAARTALAEGEVTRAADLLARAEALANNDRLRAAVAIVRVLERRATGQSALDIATHALATARAADDEDLLSEVHALLAVVHRDAGRRSAAREHSLRAIETREQVLRGLPPEIRSAFVAKPDSVALSELHASLGDDLGGDGWSASAPGSLGAAPSATEIDPVEAVYPIIRHGNVSLHAMKRRIEKGCIARAIAETHGNITRAAVLLGMKRPRLSQLVKQYGLLSSGPDEPVDATSVSSSDDEGEDEPS